MEQHLSQYRIFYAVAKTGNISKAAKELFISQPAISKAISKLEESLGLPLFTRNSRGVQLTVEGQVLFSHVSNAFDTLNRGENELRRIKDKLPSGSSQRIADELNIDVNVVRNYFGGTHFKEGGPVGIHLEKGPDGGVVTLDDASILECAMRIIAEQKDQQ